MRAIEIPDYRTERMPYQRRQTPPIEIMREAAVQLEDRTGGVVRGSVFTLNPGGSELFRHTFYLLVPDLDDYTHPLFYAWHNSDFYPAHLLLAGQTQREAQECATEDLFLAQMEQIFQSPQTRALMQALMVQAGSNERGS